MARAVPRPLLALLVVVLGGLGVVPAADAVVGGRVVSVADYPAVVALADVCTATLIGANRLMTAGHCISYVDPGHTTVRIGRDRYVATRVARHPGFRYQLPEVPAEPFRDVALVELDRPVSDVTPLRLSRALIRAGTRTYLLGYGTNDPKRLARFGKLRLVRLTVAGVGDCRKRLERAMRGQGRQFHGSSMLCTIDRSDRRPRASGCNGDSGGPLIRRTAYGPRIVAIDSWGIACGARGGDPEVFVRIAIAHRWVLAQAPPWATKRILDPWDVPEEE